LRLWTELGECVAASGVKKLVLFNAHGGQVGAMDLVARDLRARLGMLVYSVSWFNLPLRGPDGQDLNAGFSAEEHRFGIHGGDIETSMMRALAPERVRMAQAEYFRSTAQQRAAHFPILGNGRSAKLGWQMQDYNANGAVGNAAAASADKGQALLHAAGRALAQLLSEIDQLPADTLRDKTAFG
jgi:creatinine amidohydrolase